MSLPEWPLGVFDVYIRVHCIGGILTVMMTSSFQVLFHSVEISGSCIEGGVLRALL